MAAQLWDLVFALIAAVLGALTWWQFGGRLARGYLRTYVADLAWTPAFMFVCCAALGVAPLTALAMSAVIAPVAALRNVIFDLSRGRARADADIDETAKRERATRRMIFGGSKPSGAGADRLDAVPPEDG